MMFEEKPIKEAIKYATDEVDHDDMATVDSHHPLYLHANDNPSLNMISIVLIGLKLCYVESCYLIYTVRKK